MNNSVVVIFLVCLAYVIAENESNPSDLESGVPLSLATNGTKKKSWGVIYPGTKWCGQGNKARDDNDLGRFKRTDSCCRDHDRCPDKIKGGKSKHGIRNNGSVTILSCQCDDIFFDCLKGVHSKASKIVGTLYFDIVKNKCFKPSEERSEEYVLTKSRKFSRNRFIKFVGKMFG
ncbi:phospholipase A2 [Diachasma alloeum]|uniref:phospholipase A2 n=1 Tax=Diachasma alloeum TaxID=454923 RepID=UPI0007382AED|nr:phospholipase A2 [Diachasma alloeum]